MKITKPVFITTLCVAILGIVTTIYLPIHFLVIAPKERYQDYSFKYWNDCTSINELKTFVKDTVTPGNKDYVPKEYRIATFDMDGTLVGERAPIYMEWLMYQDYFDHSYSGDKDEIVTYTYLKDGTSQTRNISLRETYSEIEQFRNGVESEYLELDEAHCGAKLFAGLSLKQYNTCVSNFVAKDAEGFNNIKYKDMFYKPMLEVVDYLKQNNFDVHIVSGTDRYMVRKLCVDVLGLSPTKVIGMDVTFNLVGNELVRGDKLVYKTVKATKPELISQEIGKNTILSFGNSSGDIQMHRYALSNPKYYSKAFMVVADDVTREYGYEGEVLQKRIKDWGDFTKFSMANDWKTIYGENVTKCNN